MARGVAFEDQQVEFEAMVRPLVEGGELAPIADRDADAQLSSGRSTSYGPTCRRIGSRSMTTARDSRSNTAGAASSCSPPRATARS
jgi:hypothetical protein